MTTTNCVSGERDTITVDLAKLRRVLNHMPAWPLVGSSTVTLGDHLLDDLSRFSDRLAVFFAEREADRQELAQLRADVLAITAQPGPAQDAVIAALIEGGVLREELGIFRDGDPAMDGPRRILCGTPKSRDAAHEYLRIVRDGRTVEVRLVTEWRSE